MPLFEVFQQKGPGAHEEETAHLFVADHYKDVADALGFRSSHDAGGGTMVFVIPADHPGRKGNIVACNVRGKRLNFSTGYSVFCVEHNPIDLTAEPVG